MKIELSKETLEFIEETLVMQLCNCDTALTFDAEHTSIYDYYSKRKTQIMAVLKELEQIK